jgi:hypothetical protein
VVAQGLLRVPGLKVQVIPRAKHLASWAGVCPGNKQSAGKRLSGKTTRSNVWLRAMLGEAAWTIARTRGSSLHAQFHRLARRRGKPKAVVAVALVCAGLLAAWIRRRPLPMPLAFRVLLSAGVGVGVAEAARLALARRGEGDALAADDPRAAAVARALGGGVAGRLRRGVPAAARHLAPPRGE